MSQSKIKPKRINHKDNMELCYLRHQYLRKAKRKPTREEMKPYSHIVQNFAQNTFYVYKNLFLMVGLDLEDIVNTSQVYLISYLGLFAIELDSDKLEKFKQTFRNNNSIKCTKEDILDKNKANFTCFLKQRLQDLVRVCRQKAKNIKGLIAEDYLVFTGKKKPPIDIEELLENHREYGYRHIETSVFKSVKKKIKNQEGPVYLFKKNWYVCVPCRKKALSLNDFISNNFDPRNNLCNMNPEEYLEHKTFELKQEEFKKSTNEEKSKIVKSFFLNNRKNSEFKEEVRIARDYLRNLEE